MEDYIFLIIAIVLSIFGAINKKKKRGEEIAPGGQTTEKPSKNFFMDQLLGEDFLEASEPEIVQPVKPRRVIYKEPEVSQRPAMQIGLYHSTFKSTLPERKKNPTRMMTKKVEVEDTETAVELSEEPGIMEDFSLRKAFIYSEILQRKY
jgi:hypothetical protein